MNERLTVRFELTAYTPDSGIEVKSVAEAERRVIDARAYDHLLDLSSGTYGFKTENGEWVQRPIDGSGLGKLGLRVIQALQLHPGVFLRPREIADLVGNSNLQRRHNALAARLKAIRAAHDESGDRPRLFLTRRNGGYALQWPAEFSWIWVERIT